MPADNAEFAGPWRVLLWPESDSAYALRVAHAGEGYDVIDLTGVEWACESHRFRDEAYYLDLTLVNRRTRERLTGTFEMVRGVWRTNSGHDTMSFRDFHAAYGSPDSRCTKWPENPYRYTSPPTLREVASETGDYVVDLTTNRWKMSDWIHPPLVLDWENGETLLDLKRTYWDGRAAFLTPVTVELTLTRYPDLHPSLVVELDLDVERYRVTDGDVSFPRTGYIDELQQALGRPINELKELGETLNVRRSRRPGEPERTDDDEADADEAERDPLTSDDGQFLIELAPGATPDAPGPVRVRTVASGETPLDLWGTTWRTEASWIGASNQLLVAIASAEGAARLTAKIDFDCGLYWEEQGPDFGLPDGSPVQAAPLWELQERLTMTPGVITKAERSPETGMMWPARAFANLGGAGGPPKKTPPRVNEPTLERTILYPMCRLELYPSGVTEAAASGRAATFFIRLLRSDGTVLADTRGTRFLAVLDGAMMQLRAGENASEWIVLDLVRGEFWWENYREPTSAPEPLDGLRVALE